MSNQEEMKSMQDPDYKSCDDESKDESDGDKLDYVDEEDESISMSKGKQRMPNPNRNQRYEKIQDDIRAEILFRCLIMNEPLRPICKELGINFSSAKNVVQVYKKEGRLNKKTSRLKRTANGELVERIDQISHQTIEELKKKLCPIKVVKNDISGDILLERNDEIYIPMSGRTGYDCIKIKHDVPSYLEKFTPDDFEEVFKIAERDLEKLQNP